MRAPKCKICGLEHWGSACHRPGIEAANNRIKEILKMTPGMPKGKLGSTTPEKLAAAKKPAKPKPRAKPKAKPKPKAPAK